MKKQVELKLVKWPFQVGDAVFLGVAWLIYSQSKLPMGPWEIFFCVLTVACGALLGVTPFLLEYRAVVRLAEAGALATTVAQIQHLDLVAIQINRATTQWQGVQEESTKTVSAAREIADRMTSEARAFTDFMQKANNSEIATLRLEIEKLRRAENDWQQVLMRILDHVYALHQAALRSGQPGLVEQLGHFQNACYDVSRRIGLIPFLAATGKPFDTVRHRLVDEQARAAADARVSETIATGYTYQGQLLRPALVSLQATEPPNPPVADPASTSTARSSMESNVAASRTNMPDDQRLEDSVSSEDAVESMASAEQPPIV
jgi:molecular chaperone GrpE (heat shock protein)